MGLRAHGRLELGSSRASRGERVPALSGDSPALAPVVTKGALAGDKSAAGCTLASSVGSIRAALTSLQAFLLRAGGGGGGWGGDAAALPLQRGSAGDPRALPVGGRGPSPARPGVSPRLGCPVALCPGKAVSGAAALGGGWLRSGGCSKGAFRWQILGKLQVTARKWWCKGRSSCTRNPWLPQPACTVPPASPPALRAQDGLPAVQRMVLPSLGSGSALPASLSPTSSAREGEDSSGCHCRGTLSLSLRETGAAAPCAVAGQPQRSQWPLGYWGSRPGPAPSLASDFRGVSRASPRPPHLSPPPQPRSRWRVRVGDSPRETPTQYKPQRVNNYGCDCSGTSAFPGGFNGEAELCEGRGEVRTPRRPGRQEQGPERDAAATSSYGGCLHPAHRAAGLREKVFP